MNKLRIDKITQTLQCPFTGDLEKVEFYSLRQKVRFLFWTYWVDIYPFEAHNTYDTLEEATKGMKAYVKSLNKIIKEVKVEPGDEILTY